MFDKIAVASAFILAADFTYRKLFVEGSPDLHADVLQKQKISEETVKEKKA
jgi:hypothetical protein